MKEFYLRNRITNWPSIQNFSNHKNTVLCFIFLFVSLFRISAQNKYAGYYRVGNSNVLFRHFGSEANISKYETDLKTLTSLESALELIPKDTTIIKKINDIKKSTNNVVKSYTPIGTIVEIKKEVAGTDFYELAVLKIPKVEISPCPNNMMLVQEYHTYYVSKYDIENNFDLQEHLFFGLITMPFIYTFNDNKVSISNTVAANLKYKCRLSNDHYFSIGAIIGGSIFSKAIEKSDSTSNYSSDISLMLGFGISHETIKSINVGLYGGYALGGLNPGAWISVILGIDLKKLN